MNKILLIITVAFLTGCGANYSIPPSEDPSAKRMSAVNDEKAHNLITFYVNGEEVRTTGWTISRFTWKSNIARIMMNITSNMHDEKRTINVNLNGSAPGNYTLSSDGNGNNNSYGSYYPDYINDQVNSFSFTSGAFELTEVDTVKNIVNGSFYGRVKNSKGDSLEISDGRIINGLLTVNIANY